jgi:AcrR family transcriptional regulator
MATEPGLRERKRIAAMRRIQEVALDLFDERGFANVTIEEIAAAAEVSPSSVYRYFGTKEQVALHDEVDLRFFESVEAELPGQPPIEAVRRAITRAMAELFDREEEELARRKTRYWLEEPALQAAAAQQTDQFTLMVAEALARASAREVGDLEVQVTASVLVWALVAAVRHWHQNAYERPLEDELQQALDIVAAGLRSF